MEKYSQNTLKSQLYIYFSWAYVKEFLQTKQRLAIAF